MAYHVLDVMEAVGDACGQGKHIDIGSTCEKPAPLPLGLMPGAVDE
jgi:hypothetical protein